jgi:tetratricopeptide (TPR) repeat protein
MDAIVSRWARQTSGSRLGLCGCGLVVVLVATSVLVQPGVAYAAPDSMYDASGRPNAVTTGGAEFAVDLDQATDRTLSQEARLAACARVQSAGPDGVAFLQKRLAELRRAVGGGVATAVRAARESAGGDSGDLALGFVRTSKGDPTVEKRVLSMLLVLRGLAHAATMPALRELVAMTEPFEGAFRPEITRLFKALGEAPIPALLEARRAAPEVRKWSQAQLEALGKRTAGDAAQVQSSEVLCDVLRAWGATKDPEAVSVVLTFVNSDRVPVRHAAREALAAYGQESIWKLRESYLNLTGKAATEGWSAEQTAKELFAAFDKVRLSEVYDLLDAGLKLAKDGKPEAALEAFDKVLAREPLLERRREMVATYMQYADGLVAAEPAKALGVYRRARYLDPAVDTAAMIDSAIMTLEAKELADQGVFDAELLKAALVKDPSNQRARAALEGYGVPQEAKREANRRTGAAIGLLCASLLGILIFGRKRRVGARA